MALVAAVLTWWRLRFRPSAEVGIWWRQAAMRRRTAGVLGPLGEQGYLILHDITPPGWPASLDHLVVGPTGVWVVESSQRRRRLAVGGSDGAPAGTLGGLRGQAKAIAEVLEGGVGIPVRGVLCLQGGWPGPPRSLQGIWVVAPRQLADVVRHGSRLGPGEVELATSRLLEVLRPAA